MPVWSLRADLSAPIWERWRYIPPDETDACLRAFVLADSEADARALLAANSGGDEPSACWTDPVNSSCVAISLSLPEGFERGAILMTSSGITGPIF